MENISSFLKTTVSILITLAIITSGLFLWYKTQPIVDMVNDQTMSQAKELAEQQYAAFDNQLVSGSQVLTAYRRYSNNDGFALYIRTNTSGSNEDFGMKPSETNSTCRNFNYTTGELESGTGSSCSKTEADVTNNMGTYYIPPQARFRSTLVRDQNESIIAIYFKAQ